MKRSQASKISGASQRFHPSDLKRRNASHCARAPRRVHPPTDRREARALYRQKAPSPVSGALVDRTNCFLGIFGRLDRAISRLFCWHVLRYLARHPLLAALNVATIALGIALYLAIQIANHSANRAFEASVDVVAGKAQLEIRAPDGNLPDRLFPMMTKQPGVSRRHSDRAGICQSAGFSRRISRPSRDRYPDQ